MHYHKGMRIEWSEEKNELLKANRNLSFEQVKVEIVAGRFIGPEDNPARDGQKRILVKIGGYPVIVPFVVTEEGSWFLKTAYKCRAAKGRI